MRLGRIFYFLKIKIRVNSTFPKNTSYLYSILKTKFRILISSICTLISSISILKTKIRTLMSSISTLISSISTLKTKISTLKTKIRTLKTKISILKTKISTLKKWFQKVQKVACHILIHFFADNGSKSAIHRKTPLFVKTHLSSRHPYSVILSLSKDSRRDEGGESNKINKQ